ncbi:STE/STE11 kinase [Rhizoctonia solani]|uniref:STE/STE11 kinase n=1 Tax=Rhizoctonia solani TaxID=456999 RepID=A0A8H8T3H0_9AGAM|nr:STE/STE11 kinase [Rhizoctonia solani]QRW27219.1 STE/STE11 kinase [Rhizoctonia solani]
MSNFDAIACGNAAFPGYSKILPRHELLSLTQSNPGLLSGLCWKANYAWTSYGYIHQGGRIQWDEPMGPPDHSSRAHLICRSPNLSEGCIAGQVSCYTSGRPMEIPYYQLVPTNELLMRVGFVNTPGSETEDIELKDRHILDERDELARLLPELEKAGIPREPGRINSLSASTTPLTHLKPASKRTFDQAEWEAKLKEAQVSKDDLNRIVMDYLVTEGYKSAADEFCKEANMPAPAGLNRIDKRIVIRDASAILDANPSLYFHLQQQRLIEYIRAGRTTEALQFAQSELAPRGFENPEFLSELERTMALLAFDQVPDPPADIAELLLPAQRTGQLLIGLMRLLAWGEHLLEERATFPRVDLGTDFRNVAGPEAPRVDEKVPQSQGFDLRALDNTASESYEGSYKDGAGSRFIERLKTWGVESRGIYPVPVEHRTDPQFSKSFFVWLSCNLNILSFSEGTVGVLVYGLTFRQAAGVIVGFNLLSALPPAYFSTFGPKLGLRQMVQARYSFGYVNPSPFSTNTMILSEAVGSARSYPGTDAECGLGWKDELERRDCYNQFNFVISFFGYRILNWYERVAWFPVLVMYLVVLGIGGKDLTSGDGSQPLAPARSVLSFGATVAAFIISYAALMSDYTNYMRVDVASWKVFLFSYLGLLLPTASVQLIGAAFAASLPANASWMAGYEAGGAGGLVDAILSPSKGFARVPRYAFSIAGTGILIPLAIVGSTRFEETLVDFLGLVGYWSATFIAVVAAEHVVFRQRDWTAYDISQWNTAGELPPGMAAIGACVCSFGVIVPCMDQVWFTGPIARTTGDIGFEVGLVLSGLLYIPLRTLEKRVFRRRGFWDLAAYSAVPCATLTAYDDDGMAAVEVDRDAQTPRRRGGRRAIKLLVLANPDRSSSSDEDTPAENYFNGYTTAPSRPATIRASSPRRTAPSPRAVTSPSPTSYVGASGSSARSSDSPGPESTPPPPTPSQNLPPLDLVFNKPSSKPHVTPNLPVGEDSDNAEAESSQRRSAAQASLISRVVLYSAHQRIIVAVTHDAENYVVVDLTGHTDAQAIRERILSKLHIPDDLHSSIAIYRTELGGFAIGPALDDNQLLIDCQHFVSRCRYPCPPATPDYCPRATPLALTIFIFSGHYAYALVPSRRSVSPASDRLASAGYEASVSAVSDHGEQDMARSPVQALHRHPASRRGRQSTSWRVRRRGSGSGTSDMSPVASQPAPPGSSPELTSSLSATRAQERRGSVTPTPTATRSPPGFDETNPNMNPSTAPMSGAGTIQPHVSVPAHPTHARRPSEPDSAYEREMALAAEERRREEETERWMAKQRADLASKRQQWARDHPGLANTNPMYQNGASYQNGSATSGYTSGGSNSGYIPRGAPSAAAFPPNRTSSPMRTPSGHGRRPTDARPPTEQQYRAYQQQQQQQQQQQPQAPVRQQDPHYSRQPQRARQPSPGGQPFVQQAPPPPPQPAAHPTPHAQTYPYPQQHAYPQQPQQYQQQSYSQSQQPQYITRNVPAGPPRGAMPPRTPGSEYVTQASQQWSYDSPDVVHRMNTGGTIGPMSGVGIAHQRAQSPQLRGGARSMGNLRESYGAPPAPPPPPPAAQWASGRGPSPGPVITSPPGQQVLSPAVYDVRQSQPEQPPHRQASHDGYRHSNTSPLQQSQTIQPQLPPPSMQQYHQQGAGRVAAPVDQQRQPNYGQYVEPQRTGGYMEPQRTGGGYSDQRASAGYDQRNGGFDQRASGGFEPPLQRTGGFIEPQRTGGFIEPQRTGGPFLEQQKTGGGYVQQPPTQPQQPQGYDRYERERLEMQARERKEYEARRDYERKEYEQQIQQQQQQQQRPDPVPIQRPGPPSRQQTGTSPSHTSAMPRTITEPVSVPRATGEAIPRNANEFSTSPRPAGPLSNWNPQNMVGLNRPNEPGSYYNPNVNGNPNPASLADERLAASRLLSPPSSSVHSRHTMHFPLRCALQRPVLDERVDDAYGGIEEPSVPLSLNTNALSAPPPYRTEPESSSPSSVAGEPSPIPPQTPPTDHSELEDSGTASPSASDASTVGYPHARDTDSDRDSTTAVSESDTADVDGDGDIDADAGTLKAGDYRVIAAAIERMVIGKEGAITPPLPPAVLFARFLSRLCPSRVWLSRRSETELGSARDWGGAATAAATGAAAAAGTGAPLVRRTATRPKGLRLRIDGSRPSSHPDSTPTSTQESSTSGTFIASTLPSKSAKRPRRLVEMLVGAEVGATSQPVPRSQAIKTRPPELDQFFPNHDLDKPVIDAPSGGTSPITTEAPPMAGPVAPLIGGPGVRRHKKSIRVVAAERKKMLERINAAKIQQPPIDDSATYMPDSDSATLQPGTMVPVSNILRKRSTKMWGGRVEEVTPGSAALGAGASPNVPETIPEGGPGRQRPTFNFGRVYHAMNLTTGEMIAVKQVELPKTDSDRADSRQVTVVDALKSESDTLRDLDHPHIVQYLGFEETADVFSVFLEYVPGGSVGSVLRKFGKFEDEVVRSFSRQIIDGLAYLHKSGILHRDLKGDNILVDRSGICKISDFGISKRSEHVYNNHEGTAMQGSVFWMAPEMLHSNKQGYNAKIDIWSVGCVVLEMQAGRRPWTEDDMFAVMYKVGGLRQAPPVPDDVILSPLADDFRRKCFAVDPAERPTAAELLTHPWLEIPPGWVFKGFKER